MAAVAVREIAFSLRTQTYLRGRFLGADRVPRGQGEVSYRMGLAVMVFVLVVGVNAIIHGVSAL
jgi:hypothetical protein